MDTQNNDNACTDCFPAGTPTRSHSFLAQGHALRFFGAMEGSGKESFLCQGRDGVYRVCYARRGGEVAVGAVRCLPRGGLAAAA